jgi:hypothetical protein
MLYKTEEDDDGWRCGVGPFFRDREEALDHFNKTTAIDKKSGPFTFDDSDFPSCYTLVEIVKSPLGDEDKFHPLYKKDE